MENPARLETTPHCQEHQDPLCDVRRQGLELRHGTSGLYGILQWDGPPGGTPYLHDSSHPTSGCLGAWARPAPCSFNLLHSSTATNSTRVTVAETGAAAAKPWVILQHFCRELLNLMLLHPVEQILYLIVD